jgi:hypothetical protein
MAEGPVLVKETSAIPGAEAMDRAMAGPSITGLFRAASAPRETAAKDRIKADIRGARDARMLRSPEPFMAREPLMEAAQETKKT